MNVAVYLKFNFVKNRMELTNAHILLFLNIIYFTFCFVFIYLLVAKKIKKSPIVLPNDESAYALVGLYFKILFAFIFIYPVVLILFPNSSELFSTIHLPRHILLRNLGIAIAGCSIIVTLIAQLNMKNAWRVGIDLIEQPKLVTSGLFRYSRNPIFFCMLLYLVSIFFIYPTYISLFFLIVGYALIQIQTRLEEAYLQSTCSQQYADYCAQVRRFI